MLRSGLLWLSRRQALFHLAQRNGLARAFARRFVAGETLDDALAAVRAVNARGLTASLDLLGESVDSAEEAHRARDHIIAVLDRIAAAGVVLQSCLRRSEDDLQRLLAVGARVRLVKGAYAEPAELAYRDKREVDRAFARMAERLLDVGSYAAIATHDERLIAHAVDYAARRRLGRERFEFQMLYGVRRDLQERLRGEGYAVRVYIPFGTQWYPYLMQRLAERPANVAFIVGSVIKEGLSRR